MRYGTEATGKCLLASGRVGRDKRGTILCGETSRTTGLLQNMAIKDVEELCPEINQGALSRDLRCFSYRDVFVSSAERACTGQSSRLIAKSERSRGRKRVSIEKRCSERIQIPAI